MLVVDCMSTWTRIPQGTKAIRPVVKLIFRATSIVVCRKSIESACAAYYRLARAGAMFVSVRHCVLQYYVCTSLLGSRQSTHTDKLGQSIGVLSY